MKGFITGLGLLVVISCQAQKSGADAIINDKEVERIETVLAADDMQGRKTGTPGIEKAADFISAEFKAAGLQYFGKEKSYRQEFTMVSPKLISTTGTWDGEAMDSKKIISVTSQASLKVDEKSGYEWGEVPAAKNIFAEAQSFIQSGKNYIVLIDESYEKNFARLAFFKRQMFKKNNSVIFVLSSKKPSTFSIDITHEISEQKLANVAGVLDGKSKKDEYVIFSAHYDHLGIKKGATGDSIYNGANDDAAGTTAVILLAKYFKALGNNERTIIFTTFTAEEIGGYGSQYFSEQLDPAKVMAMFNIEMIGTESKWGKNSAYITGYEKTDMGTILQKNLEGSGFTFHPDPYPDQQLFYRSDNATLARLGVPAHTISTSKMDVEPNYHKLSDEVKTLDIPNMTQIIHSIAISSKTIVAGTDSPSRVKPEQLR